MNMHRSISLPEIVAGDLSGLEPHEKPEALRQFATGIANLAHPTTAALERQPEEDPITG